MNIPTKLRVLAVALPIGAVALIGGTAAFAASSDDGSPATGSAAALPQQAPPTPSPSAPANPGSPATPANPTRPARPSGGEDCPEKGDGSGAAPGSSSRSNDGASTSLRGAGRSRGGGVY